LIEKLDADALEAALHAFVKGGVEGAIRAYLAARLRNLPCTAHDGDPLNPLLIGAAVSAIHRSTGWHIPPEAMEIGIGAYLRASK
jgi:hypothetical protein